MLSVAMTVLKVIGIIIGSLLGLLLVLVLLVLFLPVRYRGDGYRNQEGMGLQVKLRWLFGLVRVNYRYPKPGNWVVKLLCFTVYKSGDGTSPGQGKSSKSRNKSDKNVKRKKSRHGKNVAKNTDSQQIEYDPLETDTGKSSTTVRSSTYDQDSGANIESLSDQDQKENAESSQSRDQRTETNYLSNQGSGVSIENFHSLDQRTETKYTSARGRGVNTENTRGQDHEMNTQNSSDQGQETDEKEPSSQNKKSLWHRFLAFIYKWLAILQQKLSDGTYYLNLLRAEETVEVYKRTK
jgi:hypothetical protein